MDTALVGIDDGGKNSPFQHKNITERKTAHLGSFRLLERRLGGLERHTKPNSRSANINYQPLPTVI